MAGRKLDPEERRAAAIVASVLGGEVIPRDVEGAADGTRDFDVVLPNGEHVALEVTAAENPGLRSMLKAAYGRSHPAPGLKGWSIGIRNTGGGVVNIKEAAKALPPLLAVFERHGVNEVDRRSYVPPANDEVREAETKLLALGITNARICPLRGTPGELVFYGHGGFSASAEQVNAVVEQNALRKCEKLGAVTEASERHLWIWMRLAAPDIAMHTQPPPETVPNLPRGVEVVWAANRTGRLWRVRPPDPWEELAAPQLAG